MAATLNLSKRTATNKPLLWRGKLMSAGSNAKTRKGDGGPDDYVTAILYLAPADTVPDQPTLCPMADLAGCKAGCLNTAGRGAMNNVQTARIDKAKWYHQDRDGFLTAIDADITKFKRWAARKGLTPAVRLNGTSDIQYEVIAPWLFKRHPEVMFYDYTKIAKRMDKILPDNYHLTWSYSAANERYERQIDTIPSHSNVAVVFRDKATLEKAIAQGFRGRPVINADKHDMRFLDTRGTISGLYAKGKAKQDDSGFVVDL